MNQPVPLVLALSVLLAPPALAQSPAQNLAARWNGICATAVSGTLLFLRCDETLSSNDPLANLIAARGQRLDEIPGQARVATRDFGQALSLGGAGLGSQALAASFGFDGDGWMLSASEEPSLAAPWSLHFSVDVGRIDRRAGTNEAAFDADTGSITAGIDWQPGPRWQVGVLLNHVREDLDFDASDSRASTRFSGAVLTASRMLGEHWSVDGYFGHHRGRYELTRSIAYTLPLPSGPLAVSAEASARPAASRRIQGLAGHGQWNRNGWDFGLGLGLDRSDTKIDPYAESGGAGLALSVPGRTVPTRRGRLDLSFGRTISHARGVFQPSLRLGWRQEFSNPRRAVTVRLVQDPLQNAISFDTEDPDRSWGEVALGGVMTFTGGHAGFFELRQRVAHSFLQERMLAVGWRFEM